MKVNYGMTIPISTVDWHGRVSISIFFRACPFRCPYCHNYKYLSDTDIIDTAEIEKDIIKSKPFVSSVLFSGGEPFLQVGALKHLAAFAKKNGLLVGIHTNGFYPEHAAELIAEGLVDKLFIDVKASPDDVDLYGKVTGYGEYNAVVGMPGEIVDRVTRTVDIVAASDVELEIRTTVIRNLIGSADDVSMIARWVAGHVKDTDVPYVIQQGLPENSMRESMRDVLPFDRDEILELAKHAHEFRDNIWIRVKDHGNEKVRFE
ncbi:MAG TPA: anaerobic ribonucleoside-triphosphate reductase activating protein [Methanosarcinaceae archaeon]|nr:anaerobic ribonucleoside-triphosphate reductase activating protein [Methanosarcinaceae archaeon]